MAPTKMVTRCPQCGTSFRITPAQLQSARGAVRCGACLHIFKARDHLVGNQAPASESALVRKPNGSSKVGADSKPQTKPQAQSKTKSEPRSGPEPKPRQPARGKPSAPAEPGSKSPHQKASKSATLSFDQSMIDEESKLDDDDFLISDDMGQSREEEDDLFGVGEQIPKAPSHSLFDRNLQDRDEEDPTSDDTDESWAMSLLEEEEEQAADISVSRKGSEETPREEEIPSFEVMDEPAPSMPDEPPTPEEEDDAAHIRFHLEAEDRALEDSYQSEPMSARDPERSALLMNIDPEPVEMDWAARQSRSARRWLWPCLAALAVLALIAQVAWLQFDRLSRLEPYRSVYAAICPVVGCELPTLIDRSRIRAYNLVVRNHPERDGALVVDAILLNTASFEQPFPDLVLEFSDLNGETVAARQFKPSEYLSGELAGRTRMPTNQPVHLTLELVDPGARAVNYRAYIPE